MYMLLNRVYPKKAISKLSRWTADVQFQSLTFPCHGLFDPWLSCKPRKYLIKPHMQPAPRLLGSHNRISCAIQSCSSCSSNLQKLKLPSLPKNTVKPRADIQILGSNMGQKRLHKSSNLLHCELSFSVLYV